MQWEKINVCVQKWMKQARKIILEGRTKELCVEEKTSRCDLVTNVDKFIENFTSIVSEKRFRILRYWVKKGRPTKILIILKDCFG